MRNVRKWLPLFLLQFVLSALPSFALADDVASVTIGGTTVNYATLDEAMTVANASPADCEIKLLADINYDGTIVFDNPNAKITLNIGNYTLSFLTENGVLCEAPEFDKLCAIIVYSEVDLRGSGGTIKVEQKDVGVAVSAQYDFSSHPAHFNMYDGVNIDFSNGFYPARALIVIWDGKADLYGGRIVSHDCSGGSSTVVSWEDGYCRIHGGLYEKLDEGWGGVIDSWGSYEVIIYDGHFNGTLYGEIDNSRLVRYFGGYYKTTESNFTEWTTDNTGGMIARPSSEVYNGVEYDFEIVANEASVNAYVRPDESYGRIDGLRKAAFGQDVTLTAVPATGYHFVEWLSYGTETGQSKTSAVYTAKVPSDHDLDIYAFFEANAKVSVNATISDGTINHNGAFTGENFVGSITPSIGAKLPTSLSVSVNDSPLTTGEFTYDSVYGILTIPGSKVTGDIAVTAICEVEYYPVTNSITNSTLDTDKAYINQDYSATLTPDTGYRLPRGITVTVGGSELTIDKYSYNATSGAITIDKQYITGNIVIGGTAPAEYTVTNNITGATLSVALAYSDTDYTGTLAPATGYIPPRSISVTIGGNELTTDNYSYNATSGAITIDKQHITGNIVIGGTAPAEYTVTNNISDTVLSATVAYSDTDYTATLTPDTGYIPPRAITVTVGTGELTPEQYSYNDASGAVTISKQYITGNIAIGGTAPAEYTVTDRISGGTLDLLKAYSDRDYTGTITPDTGHILPRNVTVTVGGTTLQDNEYTYSDTTGILQIDKQYITADIVVSAGSPSEYTVTDNIGDGVLSPLKAWSDLDYIGTITASSGYIPPRNITVTVGAVTLQATDYTYDAETGTLNIEKRFITGPIVVTGECPKEFPVTDNITGGTLAPLKAYVDQDYVGTITADSDHIPPRDVTVTIGGMELPSDRYTYDAATGTLNIGWRYIEANIEVDGECPSEYTVTDHIVGGTLSPLKAYSDLDYIGTVTASAGYIRPRDVTVTVGGAALREDRYAYDTTTGTLWIDKQSITGHIVVSAGSPAEYAVTDGILGGTLDPLTAYSDRDYVGTILPDDDRLPPESITIRVGTMVLIAARSADEPVGARGITATPRATPYTYNPKTGVLTINKQYITGGVTITGTCGSASQIGGSPQSGSSLQSGGTLQIGGTITGGTLSPTTVPQGQPYSGVLKPAAGMTLPGQITVTVNGKTLTSGQYTYNPATGAINIPAQYVTGNIVIRAVCPALPVIPATGDETPIALYALLLSLSLFGACAAWKRLRMK